MCLSCLFYKMKNKWLFSIKMSLSSLQSNLTQDTYSINKWWKCYNILSKDAMIQMDIDPSKLTTIKKTFLIRIEQRGVLVEGAINLPVTIGTYFKCYILQRTFMVIDGCRTLALARCCDGSSRSGEMMSGSLFCENKVTT